MFWHYTVSEDVILLACWHFIWYWFIYGGHFRWDFFPSEPVELVMCDSFPVHPLECSGLTVFNFPGSSNMAFWNLPAASWKMLDLAVWSAGRRPQCWVQTQQPLGSPPALCHGTLLLTGLQRFLLIRLGLVQNPRDCSPVAALVLNFVTSAVTFMLKHPWEHRGSNLFLRLHGSWRQN